MGAISILLGIISFLGFTCLGTLLANFIIEKKELLSAAITDLASISNLTLMICIIGAFAVIGLLTGMNLIMHGLTYGKVRKIERRLRRKNG